MSVFCNGFSNLWRVTALGIMGIQAHVHHTPPHFENLVLIQKEWVHMRGQDASQVGAVHI